MNYYLSLALCACFISWTTALPMSVNWGSARAHAVDDLGQSSETEANGWAAFSGIQNYSTDQHQITKSETNSGSTSNSKTVSYGNGAPQTWINIDHLLSQDGATGSAHAGFSGGRGLSQSQSNSQIYTYG